jgi:cytidylate kinase
LFALIITIDGPAGAGKSTVAKMVADRLGFSYLDSGAIYRTLTLACLRKNASVEDEEAVISILKTSRLSFDETIKDGRRIFLCYLDGQDVTGEIRSTEVSKAVSVVARHSRVREALLGYQLGFAEGRNIVCDGRDMGTKVFPEADFKFYLTASLEARALRRHKELIEMGIGVSYEEVLKNIALRDDIDSSRDASPLRPASGAVIIDTTFLAAEEVARKIVEIVLSGKRER